MVKCQTFAQFPVDHPSHPILHIFFTFSESELLNLLSIDLLHQFYIHIIGIGYSPMSYISWLIKVVRFSFYIFSAQSYLCIYIICICILTPAVKWILMEIKKQKSPQIFSTFRSILSNSCNTVVWTV